MKKAYQSTNTILMVRPQDFAFNEQTAADNEFQNPLEGRNVREEALLEFSGAVSLLKDNGIEVLVLEKESGSVNMPDAIFPNNWFGTDELGQVHVFPMKTPNRQAETLQLPNALGLLDANGFQVNQILDWRNLLGEGAIMEGTGSLILDRVNKKVYAAISERTQREPTLKFSEQIEYEAVLFHTKSSKGFAYYHTNVVMSIGKKMALACLDCIPDLEERENVKRHLEQNHHLVTITIDQLENGFCGNLLQVVNKKDEPITVLSSTAFSHLTETQKKEMEAFGVLLPIPISTIETVGGGSIRCMMAEIFCPSKNITDN